VYFLKPKTIICFLVLCSSPRAAGQVVSAGLFNSFKSIGACVELASGKNGNSRIQINLCADMYGIADTRSDCPGVTANITFNRTVASFKLKEATCRLYAGPGLSIGYVSDNEQGGHDGKKAVLLQNKGVAGAMSARFGSSFVFGRKISLDVSLTADVGLHIRRQEQKDALLVTFYKNGIYRSFYPELRIQYHF